jgi:hypothetical protein
MTKPKKTIRNPYAVAAKKRSAAGKMKPKKDKRKSNKEQELLKENEDAE